MNNRSSLSFRHEQYILADRATHEKFANGFIPEEAGYTQERFNALPKHQQDEIVQDWALGVEVDSSFAHNPVTRESWKLVSDMDIKW